MCKACPWFGPCGKNECQKNSLLLSNHWSFDATIHTVRPNECYTPRLRVFRLVHLRHLPKEKNDTNGISFESPDIGLLEFI